MIDLLAYWQAIAAQNELEILRYFEENDVIVWNNTAEVFTPQQFAHINAVYPGSWQIELKKALSCGDSLVTVVRIDDGRVSLHATSFFTLKEDRILHLEEYFSEDGEKPEWRNTL